MPPEGYVQSWSTVDNTASNGNPRRVCFERLTIDAADGIKFVMLLITPEPAFWPSFSTSAKRKI